MYIYATRITIISKINIQHIKMIIAIYQPMIQYVHIAVLHSKNFGMANPLKLIKMVLMVLEVVVSYFGRENGKVIVSIVRHHIILDGHEIQKVGEASINNNDQ